MGLVHEGMAVENTSAYLIGRATAYTGSGDISPEPEEGNLVLQADCDSIEVSIFDMTTGVAVLVATDAPDVADVISDTLLTAGTWRKVEDGGNLSYKLDRAKIPERLRVCRVEMIIHLIDDETIPSVWQFPVNPLYSSVITPISQLGFTEGAIPFAAADGTLTEDPGEFDYINGDLLIHGEGDTNTYGHIDIRQRNNTTPIVIINVGNNTSPGISSHHAWPGTSRLLGPNYTGFRATGGTLPDAADPAVDNEVCLTMRGRAYVSASGSAQVGTVYIACDGNPAVGDAPGKVVIATTPDGSTTPLDRVIVNAIGTVCVAVQGAIATNAVGGFLELPHCAGTPTGVPVTINGIPLVVDTVAELVWIRFASGWRWIATNP